MCFLHLYNHVKVITVYVCNRFWENGLAITLMYRDCKQLKYRHCLLRILISVMHLKCHDLNLSRLIH